MPISVIDSGMICIRSVTFTTLAGLGCAPIALAQPAPTKAASTDAATTKAAPTARSKAEKIYARGVKAFDEKRFDKALEAFEEAYLLDPVPILLYNIARAHEELGAFEEASRYLTRYLDRVPDADDRPQIEQRLNLLRSAIDAEKAAAAARADADSARADAEEARAAQTRAEQGAMGAVDGRNAEPAEPSNWLAWTFMGTGTALVLLGGLSWAGAAQAVDDAQAISDEVDGSATAAQRAAHADATKRIENGAAGGWAFVGLGVAAGLVGFWLYESAPEAPAVGLVPMPNGLGLIGHF